MGEILEEFKIVFSLDDKQIEAGTKKVEGLFKELSKTITGLFAGYTAISIVNQMTFGFADFNNKLDDSTSLLELNNAEVSALGGALERFGGNIDSAISSLRNLSNHLEEAKKGSGALIEVSRRYGVSFNPFASANDTLISLSKQMGRFSAQQRLVIAQQLGLDDSLTRAFADGGKELEKQIARQKKLGVVTEEDTKISKEFNNAQLDLKDIFGALMRDFSRVILPGFTKLIELFSKFIEWVRDHKQLVISFFVLLAIAATPVLVLLGKMAIASAMAFAPIYAVVGIVTALSLVVEDIYYYFMGWDSVTGDLINKFPIIASIVEPLRGLFLGIADGLEKAINWLKDPTWLGFLDVIKTIGKAVTDFLFIPFEAFINGFTGWMDDFRNIGGTISSWFSGEGANINQNIIASTQGLQASQVPLAPQVPLLNSTTNNQSGSNYNINNNFNQNINTATPKQFADSTNSQIVNSITDIRQQNGAL